MDDPCDGALAAKSRSDLEQLCMEKPSYNMSLMKCYVERKIDAQVQKVCRMGRLNWGLSWLHCELTLFCVACSCT